jgi:hypothetical protein
MTCGNAAVLPSGGFDQPKLYYLLPSDKWEMASEFPNDATSSGVYRPDNLHARRTDTYRSFNSSVPFLESYKILYGTSYQEFND